MVARSGTAQVCPINGRPAGTLTAICKVSSFTVGTNMAQVLSLRWSLSIISLYASLVNSGKSTSTASHSSWNVGTSAKQLVYSFLLAPPLPVWCTKVIIIEMCCTAGHARGA